MFLYCFMKGTFELPMFKLMFYYSTFFNVPMSCCFMKITYRTFCLNGRILLDIVMNHEGNARKMIKGKMSKVF